MGGAAHGHLSRSSPGPGGAGVHQHSPATGVPRNSLLINTFDSAVPSEARSSSSIFSPVSEFPRHLEPVLDSTRHQCPGAPLINSYICDVRKLRLETAHDLAQARRRSLQSWDRGQLSWRLARCSSPRRLATLRPGDGLVLARGGRGPGQSEAGAARARQHLLSDVAPASRCWSWLLPSSPAAGTSN